MHLYCMSQILDFNAMLLSWCSFNLIWLRLPKLVIIGNHDTRQRKYGLNWLYNTWSLVYENECISAYTNHFLPMLLFRHMCPFLLLAGLKCKLNCIAKERVRHDIINRACKFCLATTTVISRHLLLRSATICFYVQGAWNFSYYSQGTHLRSVLEIPQLACKRELVYPLS
jgi:hypothetical protein